MELSEYNAIIDRHIFWKNRFEVALLLQTFIKKEMSPEKFRDNIFKLRYNHIEQCKKFQEKLISGEIEKFVPNEQSYKLKGFLSTLYFECKNFKMGSDEKVFYNSIQNGFLNLQIILNEE